MDIYCRHSPCCIRLGFPDLHTDPLEEKKREQKVEMSLSRSEILRAGSSMRRGRQLDQVKVAKAKKLQQQKGGK